MMRKNILYLLLFFTASLSTNSAIQPQVKTMMIFTPGNSDNTSAPVLSTNSDLSYQLLNNEHGVGTELVLLQAEQAGQVTTPLTAGGMIEVDAVSGSAITPTN